MRSGGRLRRFALPREIQILGILLLAGGFAWLAFVTDAYFEVKGIYDRSQYEIEAQSRMKKGLPRILNGERPPVSEESMTSAVDRVDGPHNWATARRTDLIAYASSLDHWVDRARDRNRLLAQDLQATETELAHVRKREDSTNTENRSLKSQLETIEQRFSRVKNVQGRLLQQINDQAYAEVQWLEGLIVAAGLDLKRHLPEAQPPESAQGGPFKAVGSEGLSPEEIALNAASKKAAELLEHIHRLRDFVRHLPLMSPLDYFSITSRFGPRKDPINGRRAMHNGLDMRARYRSAIYAPAAGKVTFAGRKGRYGRLVEIDHGNGIVTRYGHLRQILVKRGATVSARDRIGQVGNSGRSTGTHLHYEILVFGKAVDPARFLEVGKNVFKG